jgi:hypothetical protein
MWPKRACYYRFKREPDAFCGHGLAQRVGRLGRRRKAFLGVVGRQAEGSLVPSIKYVLLPNQRPPSREGHIFADNTEALTDAVATWLGEQRL